MSDEVKGRYVLTVDEDSTTNDYQVQGDAYAHAHIIDNAIEGVVYNAARVVDSLTELSKKNREQLLAHIISQATVRGLARWSGEKGGEEA